MATDNMITVEIDEQTLTCSPGEMVIQVADEAGIYIPRFCYHEKLSVAANCRMCLVEVERAPKPLPACATPVMDGMKVKTVSKKAVEAQKDTLEFLLINHPLDCPICDQGGECPLQDQAVGYGGHLSRFEEKKRVVSDHDIGPLIETEMTRCIHCTRCVRFGEEIAGVMELGITHRSEHLKIDTFFNSPVHSEVSGNAIDLCPVGALTSKPYRFTARSWELIGHSSVSPHDCVGTNLEIQTLRGEVKRVLPRVNEAVNECWISDRDRYSYEAVIGAGRLTQPMMRTESGMIEVSWHDALNKVVSELRSVIEEHSVNELGALVSPTSTFEEFYLMQKLMRGLGCQNVDHRLRQIDFSGDKNAPLFPGSSVHIDQLSTARAIVLVGSNIRKEQPLLSLRVRKASLNGAKIAAINSMAWDYNFKLDSDVTVAPRVMPYALAHVLQWVCSIKGIEYPVDISTEFLRGASRFANSENCQEIAQLLCDQGSESVLILGQSVISHPMYSCIERLANHTADLSGSSLVTLPPANSAAGWLAGCIPHRTENGQAVSSPGFNARQMVHNPKSAYLLFNVEPTKDLSDGLHVADAMDSAKFVISFQSFDEIPDYVDVALPIAPFTENAGTFISCEGRIQKAVAATEPIGEARPGWKILRVLGNFLGIDGFDYVTVDEILQEAAPPEGLCAYLDSVQDDTVPCIAKEKEKEPGRFELITDPLIYAVDPVVRRAKSLQQTADAAPVNVGLNPSDMASLDLESGSAVTLHHDLFSIHTHAYPDSRVALGCAYYPSGNADGPTAAYGAEILLEHEVCE